MLLDASSAIGKYDTAVKVGQALVDKGIKENGILLKLGQAYLAVKNYEKSAATLTQIPGNTPSKLSNLSQAYVGAKNWAEAEKVCLDWQKIDMKNSLPYELLWRVYMFQERPKESKIWAEKGLANTNDPKFRDLIQKADEALRKFAPTAPANTGKPS